MDKYLADLLEVLEGIVGHAAGFYIIQQLKIMKLEPPVESLNIIQKEQLINLVADNVLPRVCSPRKIAMFRSHMYYLMHMSAQAAAQIESTEGAKWGFR